MPLVDSRRIVRVHTYGVRASAQQYEWRSRIRIMLRPCRMYDSLHYTPSSDTKNITPPTRGTREKKKKSHILLSSIFETQTGIYENQVLKKTPWNRNFLFSFLLVISAGNPTPLMCYFIVTSLGVWCRSVFFCRAPLPQPKQWPMPYRNMHSSKKKKSKLFPLSSSQLIESLLGLSAERCVIYAVAL